MMITNNNVTPLETFLIEGEWGYLIEHTRVGLADGSGEHVLI